MDLNDSLPNDVRAFGEFAESTSLYLLRAITRTVDMLQAQEKVADAASGEATALTRRISAQRLVVGQFLDPGDIAINGLESGYKGLEESLPKLVSARDSLTEADPAMAGHSELLHTAFDRNISAVARLVECLKDVRAAIITHDLAAESAPRKSFKSVEDLIKNLRSRGA
jgi:hypothetical protein